MDKYEWVTMYTLLSRAMVEEPLQGPAWGALCEARRLVEGHGQAAFGSYEKWQAALWVAIEPTVEASGD